MCRRIEYTYAQDTCGYSCGLGEYEPYRTPCGDHGSPKCLREWKQESVWIRLDCCSGHFRDALLIPQLDGWGQFLKAHTVLHEGETVAAFSLLDKDIQHAVSSFGWLLLNSVMEKQTVTIDDRLATMDRSDGIVLGLNGCQERWAMELRRVLVGAKRAFEEVRVGNGWKEQTADFVAYFRDHRYALDSEGIYEFS
ncbi:hypothetical protein BT67DRAFT_65261 [Trichocladium antarcticum]|uniref:Uncharacterized protein n=1 Tax=Trichocladium antarcticum TaxID=1450529 RepID=A0AAN6UHC7_9PEZI|nr:hypothetical protein BT67DRAFT_65261 [Trichocladium antarcticum]